MLAVITALPWPAVLFERDAAPVRAASLRGHADVCVSPSRKASPLADERPVAEAEIMADDDVDSDDPGRLLTFCALDGHPGVMRRKGNLAASRPSARIPSGMRPTLMRPLRC